MCKVFRYSREARKEGWDIFYTNGSPHGLWQIQRLDGEDILNNDTEAWEIVANGTEPHHIAAREFISTHNSAEYSRLMNRKNV